MIPDEETRTAFNRELYKTILDNLYDGVYFVDRARRITYWNRGAERITGYESSKVVGKSCQDNILVHVDEEGKNLCECSCQLVETISDGRVHEADIYFRHRDGHRVPVQIRTTPIRDIDGLITGVVEIFSDNSSKIAAIKEIEELKELALFDSLTGIGNRRYAEINLRARIEEMQRYGWPFGILFIDIDHFKEINDVYGHDTGDETLRMVARTLLHNTRSVDFIARWGGEEFIGLILNVRETQLLSIANKFRSLIEQSGLVVGPQIMGVTVSIGATLAQLDDTADSLVKRADLLMYRSKLSGRNCVTME